MNRRPLLYYITDSSQLRRPEELVDRIRAAFAAGVDWVQMREKSMPTRALCRLVERAAALLEKGAARLLVNERLDVALACGADGVHLPADSLPAEAVRARVPAHWLIGVSCHSVGEVEAAARAGAGFAVLGPVFATPGKSEPLGLGPLREACCLAAPTFPVLALGGITLENARTCLAAGAAGLAAIRLFQSGDVAHVAEVVRHLRAQ